MQAVKSFQDFFAMAGEASNSIIPVASHKVGEAASNMKREASNTNLAGAFTFVLPFAAAPSSSGDSDPPMKDDEGTPTEREHSDSGPWEIMPEEHEDPRYDQHGFRRDARRLDREEAFLDEYEPRIEQQEQRWARHMICDTPTEQHLALDGILRAELKRLSRLGIPARRRKTLWPKLCRADELRSTEAPGYFASLLAQPTATPNEPGLFAAERQIELDLARTYPGHQKLAGEGGTDRLRSVLLAYARRSPPVGYVQGMGFVAALLLIFVEDVEEVRVDPLPPGCSV